MLTQSAEKLLQSHSPHRNRLTESHRSTKALNRFQPLFRKTQQPHSQVLTQQKFFSHSQKNSQTEFLHLNMKEHSQQHIQTMTIILIAERKMTMMTITSHPLHQMTMTTSHQTATMTTATAAKRSTREVLTTSSISAQLPQQHLLSTIMMMKMTITMMTIRQTTASLLM